MIPGDIRTMKIIKQIANTIDRNIELTSDVPSESEGMDVRGGRRR